VFEISPSHVQPSANMWRSILDPRPRAKAWYR